MKKHFCGQSWAFERESRNETERQRMGRAWRNAELEGGNFNFLVVSSSTNPSSWEMEKVVESFPEMHWACHGNCKSWNSSDYKVESWTLFEFGGRSRHRSINYSHRNGSAGLPWGSSESSKSLSQKLWSVHQQKKRFIIESTQKGDFDPWRDPRHALVRLTVERSVGKTQAFKAIYGNDYWDYVIA